jgi:hypothetical protein
MVRSKDCYASNLSSTSHCAWRALLSILAILNRMLSKLSYKVMKSEALIVILSSFSSSSSSSLATSGSATGSNGGYPGSGAAGSSMSIIFGSSTALARCPRGMYEYL